MAGGARVCAVAGIATPARFFESLTQDGWVIADALAFADHHRFTAADAKRIAAAATASGATAIVTTSKDVLKLSALGPWPVPIVEVPLDVRVEPADGFREWLLQSLADIKAH